MTGSSAADPGSGWSQISSVTDACTSRDQGQVSSSSVGFNGWLRLIPVSVTLLSNNTGRCLSAGFLKLANQKVDLSEWDVKEKQLVSQRMACQIRITLNCDRVPDRTELG